MGRSKTGTAITRPLLAISDLSVRRSASTAASSNHRNETRKELEPAQRVLRSGVFQRWARSGWKVGHPCPARERLEPLDLREAFPAGTGCGQSCRAPRSRGIGSESKAPDRTMRIETAVPAVRLPRTDLRDSMSGNPRGMRQELHAVVGLHPPGYRSNPS